MIRLLLLGTSFASAFLSSEPRRDLTTSFSIDWKSDSEPNIDEATLVESLFDKGIRKNSEIKNDEQISLDEQRADILLPTTGVSVSETMEEADRDQYKTELVQVNTLPGVAQIVTRSSKGSFDPIRYLVALSPPLIEQDDANSSQAPQNCKYVMTDVPPYSDRLAALIRQFIGPRGTLAAILLTSRTGVHYDEGPSVFTTRISPLSDWMAVFPNLKVVAYRLDVPRDCSSLVSQKLNGYGPWAWNDTSGTLEETGRPFITKQWDPQAVKSMLQRGILPPTVQDDSIEDDEEAYSLKSIRSREEGKQLLAVYTPGHTHGALSYVFPEMNVVVSGFTIPIEDPGDANKGQFVAPSMDVRGYITTSGAGMTKQMESARRLVRIYGDRFGIVLPARDDPLFLDGLEEGDRKDILLGIIEQYDKIGQVYSQIGNLSDNDDEVES